jgi:cell wall-associated NlpC family hydrolase
MVDLSDLYLAKFVDGGRGELGPDRCPQLDCWGLVMAVFERFGVVVPDFDIAANDTEGKDGAYRDEARSGRWVRLAEAETPCLVAMRTSPRAPKATNHFGVHVGGGRVLHIFDATGVHVSTLGDGPKRAPGVCGLWRFVG